MQEDEIFGVLEKKVFDDLKLSLESSFGKPHNKKRIGLGLFDRGNKEVDTRIRINDGVAELVQKVGQWENVEVISQKEITMVLNQTPDEVFNCFLILKNIAKPYCPIKVISLHNLIYRNEKVEVKLTHQYGKSDRYTFEIELIDQDVNLIEVAKELGMARYIIKTDEAYWNKWDKEVNYTTEELSDEEILEIIKTEMQTSLNNN